MIIDYRKLLTRIISLLLFLTVHLSAQNLYINEFMSSNVGSVPEILDFEAYSDWIEIYNAGNSDVDLHGYFLTDNLENKTKWPFPEGTMIKAKGYLRIWADGYNEKPGATYKRDEEPFNSYTTSYYHSNFKLSSDGEEIGLFNASGEQVDAIIFDAMPSDISYGRKPDGTNNWYYFSESTPQKANTTTGSTSSEVAAPVLLSVSGGLFSSGQTVSLSTSEPNSEIYYTLNGSIPTENSSRYSFPVTLSKTAVLRARVYTNNKLAGPINTQSYIINENNTLPVLSIVTPAETMFGEQLGIYSIPMKGRKIPVHLDFKEPNNQDGFSIDGSARISGQASYLYPQRPITLSFDKDYGQETVEYNVFKNRTYSTYNDIYLRNSGTPDNRRTLFRDALQHSLVINKMNIDAQAYRPVMTFINGQYWGIYNMREKLNKDYIANHHDIDRKNIDYLEYDFSSVPVEIDGDATAYNALLDYMNQNALSNEENYTYVASQIDVEEYIDYMIAEIYCDNINWLNTNTRWWRERKEGAKWRWVMLDMDWGFGTQSGSFSSNYWHNNLANALSMPGTQLENQTWATFIFRKMTENQGFKNRFIQRFASQMNSTFTIPRVIGILDSLEAQLAPEMPRHINRWNDGSQELYGDFPLADMNAWKEKVAVLRTFATERPAYQKQHITDVFQLSGLTELTVQTDNSAGKVLVNGVPFANNFKGEWYKGVPIELKAVPNVGFRFVKWENASTSSDANTAITINAPATIKAVFEATDATALPAMITSNTTLTSANSPYFAQADVQVAANSTLTVEAGVEILMVEKASLIVNGTAHFNGTQTAPITIRNNASSGFETWGALVFSEGTAASSVKHVKLINATNGPDATKHIGALSSYKTDLDIDYLDIPVAPFPVFIQYGNVTVSYSTLHSDKTCDLINIKHAETAVVEYCDLRGNDALDTDAIDYDDINGGIIRYNKIYNFWGFNSDGIDLGEGSKNILVEHNTIINCVDKGISVGQGSTIKVQRNLIVNCAQGVGIKDTGSFAEIDHNTFYGNGYAVAVFEKNSGAGGGKASISNSILSNSSTSPVWVDNLSELDVTYSLSDTKTLEGTGNIREEVHFRTNLHLAANSPAINSGNPVAPNDPDGSRSDMGALPFNANSTPPYLIFNEIHWVPTTGSEEFIEIYNADSKAIDISGYTISGNIEKTFPSSTILQPGSFIILTNPTNGAHPAQVTQQSWENGSLTANAINLELKDANGALIDAVLLNKKYGLPNSANGEGFSMELRHPSLPNQYSGNWRASYTMGGTPGKINAQPLISNLFINEFLAKNDNDLEDEYGRNGDWFEIYNDNDFPVDIGGFYVTDDFGRPDKYRIPVSASDITTIAAKKHLILWADEKNKNGPLHTTFKLSAGGEEIGLVQKEVTGALRYIDSISFGPQQADISFGRQVDGGSEWINFKRPTGGKPNAIPNAFKKGVLVVNGVAWHVYQQQIIQAYQARAFWGTFPFSFWDFFDEPVDGYPSTLPTPKGHGTVHLDTLMQYSTVVWVGNNYQDDLSAWEQANILEYLNSGGNVLLLARTGQSFIDGDLAKYLGITWQLGQYEEIKSCVAQKPGLTNMEVTNIQSANAVFSNTPNSSETQILFHETTLPGGPYGSGAWRKPSTGGIYNHKGGNFVYISGRPYRYNSSHLFNNVDYILKNMFDEDKTLSIDTGKPKGVVKEYNLSQNYPNPFNPTTTIAYSLKRNGKVLLEVFDVQGRRVTTLVNGYQKEGRHLIKFNAAGYASGVYYYRLKAGDFIETKKLLLLK